MALEEMYLSAKRGLELEGLSIVVIDQKCLRYLREASHY